MKNRKIVMQKGLKAFQGTPFGGMGKNPKSLYVLEIAVMRRFLMPDSGLHYDGTLTIVLS
jgi:hypothetical protein